MSNTQALLKTSKDYLRYSGIVLLGIILLPHTAVLAFGLAISAILTVIFAIINQLMQIFNISYPSIIVENDINFIHYPPFALLISSIILSIILLITARWLWTVTVRYWQFMKDELPANSVEVEKVVKDE